MIRRNKDCTRHYGCECYLDRITELEEALEQQIKFWSEMESEIQSSDDTGDEGVTLIALEFVEVATGSAKEMLTAIDFIESK